MRAFFGLDDDWVRPLPSDWLRRDVSIAVFVFLSAVIGIEVMRSLGVPKDTWPRPALYIALFLGAVPLIWRRRFPITVMLVLALHMFVFGVSQYIVMANTAMQGAYFFSIFTAMAWGRDRRVTLMATGSVILFMFGWVAVQLSVASMRDQVTAGYGVHDASTRGALFGAITGAVLLTTMINMVFFFTAIGSGATSWRGARARGRAEAQARTIEAQSARLAEQAVVEERLRIARELHDVVAHHVAAIGIQAAAARKVMTRNPESAEDALTNVEGSSREAVTQMRSLLGTLRAEQKDTDPSGPETSEPGPGLAELPELLEQSCEHGLSVQFANLIPADVYVPGSVEHSLYRTIQEALTNVRRHSSATSASVVLRHGELDDVAYVETEILDNGRPKQGTSGSGLGLLGMRERVVAHRGTAEIGPRLTGGYRVRVRLPLLADSAHGTTHPQEGTRGIAASRVDR